MNTFDTTTHRVTLTESEDKPVVTPDDMGATTFWSIVAVCVAAFLAAISPAFWCCK
jgi:hypothetical protein